MATTPEPDLPNFPSPNTHSLIRAFHQFTQGLFKEVDVFGEQVNVIY